MSDISVPLREPPAVRIVKKFGGLTKAARAWHKSKSTVQRWQESGYIHPDYYDGILAAAVAEGVVLDARDFNLVDVDHPAFARSSIQDQPTSPPDSDVVVADGAEQVDLLPKEQADRALPADAVRAGDAASTAPACEPADSD